MSREPVIRVENLTAAYGDDVILRDVSFEVGAGEVFFIIGGSGCGKSTLLRHMVGLHAPRKGKVLIGGRDMASAYGDERNEILRRIGVSYQSGALFGSMTLLENVRLPLEEWTDLPPQARDLIAVMKLDLVGLREFANHMPAEVSGGMQKRAGIARAMALDPHILFLDEPSAGLDPVTSAELDELIASLRESLGIAFVIVSHELDSIYAIADRAMMLERESRTVVAVGRPGELRDTSENESVRRFFHRQSGASAAAEATSQGSERTS